MIHYIYVGHFIPEDGLVRHQGHTPVVTRPIDRGILTELLKARLGGAADLDAYAAMWGVDFTSGFLITPQSLPTEAVEVLIGYVEMTGAVVYDQGFFRVTTSEGLWRLAPRGRREAV